ncbi:TetR/AcrR family transcriptional regulator [Streptomyces calvus]|uniref:AcrR family transcriptional regulator n=1 Tax=Streptomyces calvus TaxID=67282 RepID=A0AA40SEY1_9ACTN|nr:AcrR family transcriptional regulator [Streptomyces calvus]
MSSTTPMSSSPPPPPAASLTERRKAETRMEIARAAAGLFVRQGLRATRAEEIAQAAGIAPRTFYRYFATKEEAIGPLYAVGARRWVDAVRAAPAEVPLPQALEDAVRHTLTPGVGVSTASWNWVRTLIRLAEANPALRRVWAEVCRTSERDLTEALMERLTHGQEACVTKSREPYSARSRKAGSAQDREACDIPDRDAWATPDREACVTPDREACAAPDREACAAPDREAGSSLRQEPSGAGRDNDASRARSAFAAAVASAAVRTAMESWAAGDGPAEGPAGPAQLALDNLAALRDFPWADVTRGG